MVNALIQQGPLSISFNAEQLQFYKYGVWNPPGCDSIHAVLLVGYGLTEQLGLKWGTDGYS